MNGVIINNDMQKCDYCQKLINDKSAAVYIGGEKCAIYCSTECMNKMFKKGLRALRGGMKMTHKSSVCGKRTSNGFELEPDGKIPEVTKPMWICSTKCSNAFFSKIKRNRKAELRKTLKNKTENATGGDYMDMWVTLTPKEQKQLAMIGFGYLRTLTDKTPAGFYKELQQRMIK